jgi:hypothetical protein
MLQQEKEQEKEQNVKEASLNVDSGLWYIHACGKFTGY